MGLARFSSWARWYCLPLTLAGCSGAASNGESGDGTMNQSFVPAVAPMDVCALLSVDDVSVLIPGPVQEMRSDTSNDLTFDRSCSWINGGRRVDLVVSGAFHEEALSEVVGGMPGGGRGKWTPLSGLGDAAGYYSADIPYCGVVAHWHSYAVDLSLISATPIPLPPAETFVPRVRKVLGQLE
jgi:hypothetical protein